MIEPKEDPRHGLIIRDRFVSWSDIERQYVCRHCHNRVGKPYADPITGKLDHDRKVCGGPMEHEIRQEGDLVHARQIDWLEDHEFWNGFEVRGTYGQKVERSSNLFTHEDNKDFEGW